MIDFRYHLVSIVAVFLALAIGIVLGSTELQGPAYNFLNSTTAKLQNELNQASSQRDAAQQQADLGQNYAQAIEPVVLHNLLAGQRLLIITEPDAPASVVTAISSAATQDAGATVTGQIALQPKFFDSSGTTLDSLNQINQAMSQADGIVLTTGTTYQDQAAQVIAGEILTRGSGSSAGALPVSTDRCSHDAERVGRLGVLVPGHRADQRTVVAAVGKAAHLPVPAEGDGPGSRHDVTLLEQHHVVVREVLLDPLDVLTRDRIVEDELRPRGTKRRASLVIEVMPLAGRDYLDISHFSVLPDH